MCPELCISRKQPCIDEGGRAAYCKWSSRNSDKGIRNNIVIPIGTEEAFALSSCLMQCAHIDPSRPNRAGYKS